MKRTKQVAVGARWLIFTLALCTAEASAQEPARPQPVSAAQLQGAIDKLGDLKYEVRTDASRLVRRTPAAQAVPALIQAVSNHTDGFVRYRALVLVSGFNDPRAKDVMRESLTTPNDRLRSVAFSYFEHNPDRALIPNLMSALEKETSEFVRPALIRALASAAASFADQGLRQLLVREAGRGQDFFRSAVIEALGDYKATYAADAIAAIAKLDGPLQSDAALALGKTGPPSMVGVLAELQRTAPRQVQPSVAAAICGLGVNCPTHENFLVETIKFADKNPGFQELLRTAVGGLGALGVAGRGEVFDPLLAIGVPSKRESTRAPITIALATIALRNTPLLLSVLEKMPDRAPALELIGEGFDQLEEDYEKERFFAFVRRNYWDSAEGSPTRALMQTLIGKLDF
jgi:HEAT repeat protein